ncbi:MAG: hypothetical protein ACE5GM_09465 [bacterium]
MLLTVFQTALKQFLSSPQGKRKRILAEEVIIFIILFVSPAAAAGKAVSPQEAVAGFCRLDGAGYRLSEVSEKDSDTVKSLLLYPDKDIHSGKDLFYIYTDYRIIYGLAVNSEAVVHVEYTQKWIASDWKLVRDEQIERLTFKLLKAGNEWKILKGFSFPRVSLPAAVELYKRKILRAVDRQEREKIKLYSDFLNELTMD